MQLSHEIVRFADQDRERVDHFAARFICPAFPPSGEGNHAHVWNRYVVGLLAGGQRLPWHRQLNDWEPNCGRVSSSSRVGLRYVLSGRQICCFAPPAESSLH